LTLACEQPVEQAPAHAHMNALLQWKIIVGSNFEPPDRSSTNKPGNLFDEEISQEF
jgi:hypothetical protein